MLNPNPDRPNLEYEFLGVTRVWRWTKERMQNAYKEGKVIQTKPGSVPRFKRYLDEQMGKPIDDVWIDIPPLNSQAQERLGYPTQKPQSLLERIIASSSNENDIVLDAFCGCGTAIAAAENLGRQWIGMDISPTACKVMAKRMRDDFSLNENESLQKIGRGFVVRDLPWSEDKLKAIPPFEFENWAVIAIGGIGNTKKVNDKGIDGRIFPVGTKPLEIQGQKSLFSYYPIQVKQKKAGRPDIDKFETAMRRSKQKKGFFVSFDYSEDALREIDRFFREEKVIIIPLTVKDILDEEIARKLA